MPAEPTRAISRSRSPGFTYQGYLRSSQTDGNGMPALATTDDARLAQASLQHVVVTFDPVNGRRIYVNGVFSGDVDKQTGGTLGNWDNTFALVLGNEVSSNRSWAGVVRMVVIHNRALSDVQIKQNFAAGVGEKYFLLFNVEQATGVSKAYVMFEVSQYDSYSYLFNKPTFISLDPSAKPDGIVVKGIRIGINGVVSNIGQAYIPLNTTVTSSNYFAGQGQLLSPIGMVLDSALGSQVRHLLPELRPARHQDPRGDRAGAGHAGTGRWHGGVGHRCAHLRPHQQVAGRHHVDSGHQCQCEPDLPDGAAAAAGCRRRWRASCPRTR
ncbi:MAG: LamG-like jellyroll fold domain-containing protein [Steroidobacteraceae bacterium]